MPLRPFSLGASCARLRPAAPPDATGVAFRRSFVVHLFTIPYTPQPVTFHILIYWFHISLPVVRPFRRGPPWQTQHILVSTVKLPPIDAVH